ncbi:hypothetical protein EHV15_18125 [Paenibacillus oralis]|uniref:PKD domain-containing protein n=1 Tax=Paenibacillus oralis TaxID=2490856 RepID=A0A3P3U4P8_9BACL|nr:hypothetical protein [Paenibacillus oralis]RRJ64629.1 hypothetical protein EHV15_18125 [Paenibacillus oralis]
MTIQKDDNKLYDGLNDPQFQHPYVDIDEWRDVPVRHRYIHGGFEGDETRFSFYFPKKESYEGRFFQPVSPVQGSENAAQSLEEAVDNKIGFAISSGGYLVETNMGGPSDDITKVYRASAAVALYSRVKAVEIYGPHRPYGYIYGGSGGGYKTISFMENTTGVWDGAVPFVIGSPVSIPNVFSARIQAMRLLWNKFPQILDAMEPGGNGDMYAGLNEEERQVLDEVTRMGFPPKAWFVYQEIGDGALTVLLPAVLQMDPSYFEDFWTVPGYQGADPNSSVCRARLQHRMVITEVIWPRKHEGSAEDRSTNMGVDEAWKMLKEAEETVPKLRVETVPQGDVYLDGAFIRVVSGNAAGLKIPFGRIEGDIITIESSLGFYTTVQALEQLQPGDEIILDNSDYLAIQTYHRHQMPTPDFYVWDQFRNADGDPIYPQRSFQVGPAIAFGGAGSLQSGKFEGKMIVVEALMDESAFPWQADWYRTKVKEHLGEEFDNRFRLYFIDRALHADSSSQSTLQALHYVSYIPALNQALRDLCAWVERGGTPPSNTRYKVIDGQVIVPDNATEREGIQPVITLSANGKERAEVSLQEAVTFRAEIEVPPGTGKVTFAKWDFYGEATFEIEGKVIHLNNEGTRAVVETTHSFSKPGTYFPVLRAASQREGNVQDIYTQILNLSRVRVVVK